MGGHATHDEREARATFAPELFEHWGKRDPIGLFEVYLIEGDLDLETGERASRSADLRDRNAEALRKVEARVIAEVEAAAQEALASSRQLMPRPESASEGVYAEPQSLGPYQAVSPGLTKP
jgi:TPP-dependent pyruvate/acetoin dehydrogenase alpha subunit